MMASSSSQPLEIEKLSSNVFPQPQLSTQPLLQPQPQLSTQPLLQPQPQSTSTSAAQSSSSRLLVPVMHKNRLQQYAQRSGIQMPIYHTRSEGMPHDLKFKSTVEVDGCIYTSPNSFSFRKAAEQDAAKFALEHISKNIKDEGCPHIREDTIFCKSILNEFAVKMNLKKPTYNTVKQEQEGFLPIFTSSLGFNGLCYTGDVGRNKKEAEQLAARAVIISLLGKSGSGTVLTEIIKSKDKLYAALHKLKDTSHENISAVPQAVGVSIGQSSGQVSQEVIVSKPEPSQAVNLPIEFVPAVLPEPSDEKIFKSLLNEFAVKMNLKQPTYNTVKQEQEGFLPVFTSTLVFNGLCYTGEAGRNKKEAEQLAARAVMISLLGKSGSGSVLSETAKSKHQLYAPLHKLKDTSHENISAVPQAVGISIGQNSGQVSQEFIVSKPEPSQAVNLPIDFVPAVLPEPSDVGPSSLKKRRKNKKKPNKKLRSDTPLSIAVFPMTQAPPCSVAQ